MAEEVSNGVAVLKLVGRNVELVCDVVSDQFPMIVVSLRPDAPKVSLSPGDAVAIVETKLGQTIPRHGTVGIVQGNTVTLAVDSGTSHAPKGPRLTECQLPAMLRSRTEGGAYGGWRGACIVKHSPNRIHLLVDGGAVVPKEAELMFSPIGSEHSGATRMIGDEGAVLNAADVRSRRIRVRALTRDVLASPTPGTVVLVLDISRTLYRAA